MKQFVSTIIKDSQLLYNEISFLELETIFAYFEEQDDFFIFILESYPSLKAKLQFEDYRDLQFALNQYINDYKKEHLVSFANRNIDYNLSLILVLEESESEESPKLGSIEENPFNSKKYILKYTNPDFEILSSKISYDANIIQSLNQLAINESHLLQNTEKENIWYDLLMKFFIKIPFLNYLTLNGTKELENLESSILDELSKEQKIILDEILLNYDPKSDILTSISKIESRIKNDE